MSRVVAFDLQASTIAFACVVCIQLGDLCVQLIADDGSSGMVRNLVAV